MFSLLVEGAFECVGGGFVACGATGAFFTLESPIKDTGLLVDGVYVIVLAKQAWMYLITPDDS